METINDDLNIPLAMGIVWEIVKNGKKSKQFAELLLEFDKVLGVDIEKNEDKKEIELKKRYLYEEIYPSNRRRWFYRL